MKLTLEFFTDDPKTDVSPTEIARILRDVASRIERNGADLVPEMVLSDATGHGVGLAIWKGVKAGRGLNV